jgi:chorismate mutase / prephenate dehydratase
MPSKEDLEKPQSTRQQRLESLAVIDRRFLNLLEERARLLEGWNSESRGSPGEIPSLWEQLDQAERLAGRGPTATEVRADRKLAARTFAAMACFSAMTPTPVAYLGPKYSYSYLAAVRYFTEAAQLSPVGSIAAVFEEIIRGQSKFGVVPIENSTDGRIVDTLTMLAKHPVRICGELLLPIHHCLLGRCQRADIVEVYSKPQALSQCRTWLSQHLPEAKLIEISSTTAAAKLASEKANVAAIASMEAGIHYGLEIIQANIEDNPDNLTRFAILGDRPCEPTGHDKTSIMFQIPHRSGMLAEAMQIFRRDQLNLTWIESFPIPGNSSEYLFFIEFEGHREDRIVVSALNKLAQHTLRLDILGSYPRGQA